MRRQVTLELLLLLFPNFSIAVLSLAHCSLGCEPSLSAAARAHPRSPPCGDLPAPLSAAVGDALTAPPLSAQLLLSPVDVRRHCRVGGAANTGAVCRSEDGDRRAEGMGVVRNTPIIVGCEKGSKLNETAHLLWMLYRRFALIPKCLPIFKTDDRGLSATVSDSNSFDRRKSPSNTLLPCHIPIFSLPNETSDCG